MEKENPKVAIVEKLRAADNNKGNYKQQQFLFVTLSIRAMDFIGVRFFPNCHYI